MAKIDANTIKIRECGTDILKLTDELNEVINYMYKRLNNMAYSTGEWIGTGASKFVACSLAEKKQYIDLKDALAGNGKFLIDYADSLEQTVRVNGD